VTERSNGNAGPARLLVVDDEPEVRELIMDVAGDAGLEVAEAGSLEELKAALDAFRPDVISLDLQMPDADGIEHLRYLAEAGCQATVILVSGFDRALLESARKLGAHLGLTLGEALTKPLSMRELSAYLASFAKGA
jgi:DNA-binding response OmpR family regulator